MRKRTKGKKWGKNEEKLNMKKMIRHKFKKMRKRQKEKEKNKNEKKEKNQQNSKNTEKSLLTVGPAVRSPQSASWALWTNTCTQLASYQGFFVSFITVMPCENRARNGPIVPGDKPSDFSPFSASRPLYT